MKVRNLALVALFAALTVVGTITRIPLPIGAITLQTLVCMLAGMLLGPGLGSLSQVLYVALGLIGLPVFTNGGGPGYIFQPTFGYILGLVAGAFICGLIVRKTSKLTFGTALLAALACTLTVYLLGVPYLYFIFNGYLHKAMTITQVLSVGCITFLPGDLLKCVVAAFTAFKLRPILEKQKLIGVR